MSSSISTSDKIWVYNKKNPTNRLSIILIIITIPLSLISFLMHERWFSFIVFGLAIILGISRLISTFWRYSPFEYATQLKLNNNSISFLSNNLPLAKTSKITIELRDKEIQPLRSENNYLEIKTSEGDTFELAILIDNPSDVMAVQKLVTELKSKVSTVVFENYIV